jgi:nitronate monooxygenase
VATIGLPQVNPDHVVSPPLVTAGNEITQIARFLRPGKDSYTAADVVRFVLGQFVAA